MALYNCRAKEEHPMEGKYQTMNAVYDSCVTSPEPLKSTWVGRRKMEEKVL